MRKSTNPQFFNEKLKIFFFWCRRWHRRRCQSSGLSSCSTPRCSRYSTVPTYFSVSLECRDFHLKKLSSYYRQYVQKIHKLTENIIKQKRIIWSYLLVIFFVSYTEVRSKKDHAFHFSILFQHIRNPKKRAPDTEPCLLISVFAS